MAPILNLLEVKTKHRLREASPHPPLKTTFSAYYDSLRCYKRPHHPPAPRGAGGRGRRWAWLGALARYPRIYT